MPPYLSNDHNSGVERDIIVSALQQAGISTQSIVNVHYQRAIELAKSGNADLIVSNKNNDAYSKQVPSLYLSDTTLNYVDCAISLQEKNLKLNSIIDYYDKRIWAFKSASHVFGTEFSRMAQRNQHYSESFDQQKQLEMLAMGRIDIAISDKNIFLAKQHKSKEFSNAKMKFDTIGALTPRAVRSTNESLINAFNTGLSSLKKNGEYQAIINRYKDQYSTTCE